MRLNKYIILSISFVMVLSAYAQNRSIKKATKDFENFSYVRTSEVLLKVAENGYKSVDLFQKLGDSFYFINKMEEAAKWYGELMALNKDIDAEYYFRYAQSLKSLKEYDKSDKWMQKFVENKSGDLRAKSFLSKRDYLERIEAVSDVFEVKNMEFNTDKSDFGTNQYQDKLVFASARGAGKSYDWNDQPYLDLYAATKYEDGSYSEAKLFGGNLNTKMHESTPSFTPSDDLVFFTRNNFLNRLKRGNSGINRLQIYKATLQPYDAWGYVTPVHFNSDDYSVAHPTVNVYGTKLYFASDMPGTLGASDIYVVDIKSDGTLGEPLNLGALINTEGSETFPYINSKGDLYYSSNGLTGLGGLDVFVVRDFENKYKNHQPIIVENVGKPINSEKDDFAYYENLGTKEGFFSSNRDGGKGDDDIYSFRIPDCLQKLEGVVFDDNTNEVLSGSKVRLLNKRGEELDEMIVGDDGKYEFNSLKCNEEYLVRVEKDAYATDETRIVTGSDSKEILELKTKITPDEVTIDSGTNLREALGLNPIYFGLDAATIDPSAVVELQKVITVLKQYPNMKIDIKSHTDSRATKAYNQELSSKRSMATINYIVNIGGIDASRVTGKGYGESELVNNCSDGVDCSEVEHQLNRRSDFIILSID
ncbi:MAG: OmpA family protein [Flavobacteriaceae bacterium]|nr:OmpA family protein [Flavobacteriaceae bacterium]